MWIFKELNPVKIIKPPKAPAIVYKCADFAHKRVILTNKRATTRAMVLSGVEGETVTQVCR